MKGKRTMDYNDLRFDSPTTRRGSIASAAETFPALMRKVYVWMTLALVITGLVAYGVATSPALIMAIVSSKGLFLGMIVAELALVIGITAAINKLSMPMATLLFAIYSAINGATLSVIFVAYTMSSIANVFFITAGTFAAMAVLGYTTKKDLSGFGRILFMALIGLIIATLVNVFLVHSTSFDLIISYVGVLLFVGLTAYDTQKIKRMLIEAEGTGETAQKIALLGALSLYLDFINLFLYLLRLFGKKE